MLGLIGPNGAGKTTFMNVLSGFQRSTHGTVLLDGRDATRWGPERMARSGVSRTFQAVRPFPALSVAENVEVGALGVGVRRGEAAPTAADAILEALGLTARADQPAAGLPHGDERRLGIARALAARPPRACCSTSRPPARTRPRATAWCRRCSPSGGSSAAPW